jgi:uncharacterized protein (TIRG00374 family)
MLKKSAKYIVGFLVGALFLWLAFRNLDIDRVWGYIQTMSWGWILPFFAVTMFSHLLRSERWRLLIEREDSKARLSTLYAGVMSGYLMNYIVPRLGEVSRCVYVSKKDGLKTGELFGTVVLERVLDLFFLILFLLFLLFYVVNDPRTISRLFGEEAIASIEALSSWTTVVLGFGLVALTVAGYFAGVKLLEIWVSKRWVLFRFAGKLLEFVKVFVSGLTSIRHMKRWPYFMLLSFTIWFCYVLMTYIPLYMFNMAEQFQLSIPDAAIVMVISSIGVSLPSPGGIGTYHWFTKQALVVLFGVTEVTALAYAFVTHAFMLVAVLIFTPLVILINNLITDRLLQSKMEQSAD